MSRSPYAKCMVELRKYIVIPLLLMVMTTIINSPLVLGSQIRYVDLDTYPYYEETILLENEASIHIEVNTYNRMTIVVAPSQGTVEVTIMKPKPGGGAEGFVYETKIITKETSFNVNVDVKGTWVVKLRSSLIQGVHVKIRGMGAETQNLLLPGPSSSPPEEFPMLMIVGTVTAAAIVIVAIVAVVMLRSKPKMPVQQPPVAPPTYQPAPPPPPPSQQPAKPSGGETVVFTGRPVQQETEIMIASLELPTGEVLPIVSPRQIFGRTDFERYLKPDQANFVSRRHFMITLDASGFSIEDLGSANGTFVNGVDIRGKGKVPLKPGDEINVAGVLKLVFRAAA